MEKQHEAVGQPPSYYEATTGEAPPQGQYPMINTSQYPSQGVQPVPGYASQYSTGYVTQYPSPYNNPDRPTFGYPSNVVVQQPVIANNASAIPPQDHMCAAIFVTLCCFLPTGIIAIMKANDARCAVSRGDMVGAYAAAKSAKQLVNISIIVGIIAFIVSGVIIGLYVGLYLSNFRNYY